MSRLTKSLPKYRKHRASGQAIVTIAGRHVYLGPHNTKTSKLEYDRVVAEWLAAGRPSHPIQSLTEISVAEVMVAYMRFVKQRYVKNGISTSEQHGIRAALRRVRKLYSKTNASEFGPLSLKAVRQVMVDEGLASSSINQNVGRIKRMFRWAASEELIPASVHQSLSTVNGLRRNELNAIETEPVKPVSAEDVQKVFPFLTEILKDMIKIQKLAGMRPGEIVIMRPCDIDQSDDIWQYQPKFHKTEHRGRERIIYLGLNAQLILKKDLLRPLDAYCFNPLESIKQRKKSKNKGNPDTLKINSRFKATNQNKHYLGSSYRTAIKRACEKAKIPAWKPNQLRHAAATDIRKKFGLEAAQVTLAMLPLTLHKFMQNVMQN